jgi:hypothetical protein
VSGWQTTPSNARAKPNPSKSPIEFTRWIEAKSLSARKCGTPDHDGTAKSGRVDSQTERKKEAKKERKKEDRQRSLHSEAEGLRGEHPGRSRDPVVKVAGLAWLEFEKPDLTRPSGS